MINELDNRIERIAQISPIPENERVLREQLQLLYMIADKLKKTESVQNEVIEKSVKHFAKKRLGELENSVFMNVNYLPKVKCDLNETLLKIFKVLDKDGRRVSFFSKTKKMYVRINEKAMTAVFERLTFFCKHRMSVEIKEKRIQIKSDYSLTELIELRNRESDLMLVINKILKLHSSSIYFASDANGSEISLSLNGLLCNEGD